MKYLDATQLGRRCIPILLATTGLLVASCAGNSAAPAADDVQTPSTTDASTAPSPSEPPPEPRLAGKYAVSKTLVKVVGYSDKPGQKFKRVWTFEPECEQTRCGGTLISYIPELDATRTFRYRSSAGGTYVNRSTNNSTCGTGGKVHIVDVIRLTMGKPGPDQVATSLTAVETQRLSPRGKSDCPVGSLKFKVTGTYKP